MKKKYFILIVLLGHLMVLNAQVSGYVKGPDENGKNEPLVGVVVYWPDRSFARTTDENGFFEIPEPGNKPQKLIFSLLGYQKDSIDLPQSLQKLEVILRKGIELKQVVISEKQKTQRHETLNAINVSTITSSGLKQAACCNLAESFENTASVDVSYADALTGAKQIQLLGLTGIYTQIMTENIPSVRALASPFGMSYIPGPWMESIQVSKGTSSVRSGYEALSGQINVEFKKPLMSKELYLFNVFANSEQRWEANAVVNTKISEKFGTNLMFNTNQFNSRIDQNHDGFMDNPMIQSYNISNRYKYEGEHFESVAGYKIMDETRLGGQNAFSLQTPRDSSGPYGIYIKTRRQEAFFKGGYIYPNRVNTSTAIIVNGVNHEQQSIYGLRNYNAHHQGLFTNLIHTTYLFNTFHTLTAGANFVADVYNETLDSINLSRDEYVTGAYVEYEYKPSHRFTMISGARYDYNSRFGSLFTPRLHMRFEPIENTILKASAGKGYRSPNVIADNASILASSRRILIDQKTKMEEGWNYGVNLMQKFLLFKRKGSISAEFYRTDFINQWVVDLEQSAQEVHLYNLNGKSFANSSQIEMQYNLFKGFDLTAAYRINDVKTTYNGVLMQKPLVSKYKGFINLNYATPNEKWQFNYTAQFNSGGRIPSTASNPAVYQRSSSFNPYTIMNAQILRSFGNWEIYLGVENLTDFMMHQPVIASDQPFGPYFDASLIWGPLMGRKFYGGVRYTFKEK